ncbi:MAG: hypothetical protein CMD27_02280 [Flavobacteriales bacterium]|nr:hypothetical protein [Flavobacteriales bacterium]
MKFKLLILSIIIPFIIYSQNKSTQEKYKNGQVKFEQIFNNNKLTIEKEYYKNGQLKYQAYVNDGIIEEYYKNGQLSYRKIQNEQQVLEEAYNKKGELIIQLVNNEIKYSAHENAFNNMKGIRHKNDNNNHHHGHSHDHHHDHGHGHSH